MTSRLEILKRLHAQQRDDPAPRPWSSKRHYPDLEAQFNQALTSAGGEVWLAGNLEEALVCVSDVLVEIGARKGVANNQSPFEALDLTTRWPSVSWRIAGTGVGDFRSYSAKADIGLSTAEAALAETGTVVVSSGPGLSRLTALLPPVHLVLVPTSYLTMDIFTWAASIRGAIPAAITLISGPSKTADIEQTMAVGVHGPIRFIVILYKDER